MRTCPKCKKTIENDKALFCRYCGHELSVPVEPEPKPEPEKEQELVSEPDATPEAKSEEEKSAAPPPLPVDDEDGGLQLGVDDDDWENKNIDVEREGLDVEDDDDVEIEVVSKPAAVPDIEDLLDVPTGIPTYIEDEPEPENSKPVDVDGKPMVFGGIPVMVEDGSDDVEEKPVEVETRRPEPVVQQDQSESTGSKPIYYIVGFCVLVVVVALIVNYALQKNSSSNDPSWESNDVEYPIDNPSTYPNDPVEAAPAAESHEDTRAEAIKKFCGSFTQTERAGSYNYVGELVLDPVNRSCRKVIDDGAGGYIVNITNSIGYLGSEMQMVAYWNILSFNMSDDGRSALIEVIPEFGDGVGEVSRVKLRMDEYGNITMSHVSGSSSPAIDGEMYFTRN